MKIVGLRKNSIAHKVGIKIGDELIAVNGRKVEDEIDYRFYAQDEELTLEIRRNGETTIYEIEAGGEDLGLQFEEMQCRSCGNHCIFCFVDQNPPGVRPTLLFKDEDFRLSFLHGSYVTLTNLSRRQLQRIVEQRLSPLYISVHAVDPDLRRRMLGLRRDDRLLDKIAFLAEHRIEMQTQIVLCPGWNDGAALDETIETLAGFSPSVAGIAVVPVGLTKHRQGLVELRPVSEREAAKILKHLNKLGAEFTRKYGKRLVYPADEFFLLAGEQIPDADYYDDFPQIENGVGMVRRLLDDFDLDARYLPAAIRPTEFEIVTGRMAAPILAEHIVPRLERVAGCTVHLRPVENRFFGGNVAVSGLLTGGDIAEQLAGTPRGDKVILPPNCLNDDGLFLDDWTVPRLQRALGRPVQQVHDSFLELFEQE